MFNSFSEFQDVHSPLSEYLTAFQCIGCNGGYFALIASMGGPTPHKYNSDIEKSANYKIVKEYPKPEAAKAPEYLPPNIQNFFLQAANSLKGGNLDASAMMSRKVLEVAVKALGQPGKGTLYVRIEELHKQGKVTNDLKDWAHIIRDEGNVAAHEEKPVAPEFAEELLSFTELFLMYTFTMPGMIKAKKGISEDDS
jgi:hypothetical protein